MKINRLIFTLLLGCVLFACGHKETKERMKTYGDAEKEFIGSLTKKDSVKVLELSQRCMDSLQSGNIEAALAMLHTVSYNQVLPLSGTGLEELKTHFRHFPVRDYELDYFSFSTQGCNDLRYKVQFAEKDVNGNAPIIAFMFNPVKVDSIWYLCVKGPAQSSKEILNPCEKNSPAPAEVKLAE